MSEADLQPSEEPRGEWERRVVARQPALLMFLIYVLLLLPSAVLQLLNIGFGLAFAGVFFLAAPAVLWVVAMGFDPRRFLKLTAVKPSLIGLGALLGVANFFIAGMLQVGSRLIFKTDPDVAQIFRGITGVDLALVVLGVGITAPICEEIAFRGYLQNVYAARLKPVAAVVITAGLFSALHLDIGGFLARVELGCLFGMLALWSGSTLPGIAAHAANNLLASGLLLLSVNKAASAGATPPVESLPSAAVALGGLAISLVATSSLLRIFRASVPQPVSAQPVASLDQPVQFEFARLKGPLLKTVGLGAALLVLFGALDRDGIAFNWTVTGIASQFKAAELEKRIPDETRRKEVQARIREERLEVKRGEVPMERFIALHKALWGPEKSKLPPLTPHEIEDAFTAFDTGAPPLPSPPATAPKAPLTSPTSDAASPAEKLP